ncbi:hypothetical protein BH23GEM6_BH23GEM6_13820 [soil metagenome]
MGRSLIEIVRLSSEVGGDEGRPADLPRDDADAQRVLRFAGGTAMLRKEVITRHLPYDRVRLWLWCPPDIAVR